MTDSENSNAKSSYTQFAQEVLHQLGRIEGKLDAFDIRLRAVEVGAAQSLSNASEFIPRIKTLEAEVEELRSNAITRDSLSVYKRWLVVVAIPAIVGAVWAALRLSEVIKLP